MASEVFNTLCRFGVGESPEKNQLDHAAFAGVEFEKAGSTNRPVPGCAARVAGEIASTRVILHSPTAFQALLFACVIDQNAAHHARGHREQMGPVLPRDIGIDQAQQYVSWTTAVGESVLPAFSFLK